MSNRYNRYVTSNTYLRFCFLQENTHVLDFVLNAISTHNLKKRIDKVESTVSEVNKSPLLSVASKSAPHDVANKNRSKIRTASNRRVFGREAFRDTIMEKLRQTADCDAASSSTSPCYSVIGIYGVAGSGKTTFTQYISDYIKEERKEEGLFDTVICIHVTETFSVDDIFHEMLKDITTDQYSNILDHEELEEKLKESLCGKRFCLILDDLWVNTKNDPRLEELMSPLNVGLKGSKILVTARTKVSAGALCADEPMEMPDLDEDQYFSMFMHYALGSTSVVDKEFIQVGRVIVERLHRSPIAAVIVAGQLGANRDINFWKNASELHILNDTMEVLWWSYQQLSADIRRCFEYCSIFPRRFQMKKSNLVHLWIAQGFVKTSYVTEDMEDVAERYIQDLVSYSFLQQERTWNNEEFFRIHDLLHDLADIVTRTDCYTIENESSQRGEGRKGNISHDVRHLFIQNYDAELITKKILGLENLVTLIINVVGNDTPVEEEVIRSICKKLPKLRVLAFALSNNYSRSNVSIPESLSQLKHLRYLAFKTYGTRRITLPRTLNKLQHIQLLDFDTSDISEFTFTELVNLRHLFCGPYVLHSDFGRLSSLRTTPSFIVSKEQGHELKQLSHLNKLRGKLTIGGLENVRSKEQALEANLDTKRLTELRLVWGYDYETRCSQVEAEVLAGLCHRPGLKQLVMWYFTGWRCLGKDNGCLNNLQKLCLVRCSQPEPAYVLAEVFPRLLVLEFSDCSWDALPSKMENLASLKDLSIMLCKNILSLPTLPQSLEKFHLYKCNQDFMMSCNTLEDSNWQKIQHIPDKHITMRNRL
uniref:Uncharacterized protein n=2 Tax=Avena sativa TaxID=4498 RepID=A0ACD5XDS7_AVESA